MASISRRMLLARIVNCLKCFVICDSRNFYETFNPFQKYFLNIIIMSQFNDFNRKYPLSIMDLSSILSKGLHGYGVNKDLLYSTVNSTFQQIIIGAFTQFNEPITYLQLTLYTGELQISSAKYYSFKIIKWNWLCAIQNEFAAMYRGIFIAICAVILVTIYDVIFDVISLHTILIKTN